MNYEEEKTTNWIMNYGSDKLKLFLKEGTYKSINVIVQYEKETEISNKKNMTEFDDLKQIIENKNMRYTQKQYDRLSDLRNIQTKMSDTYKIEQFIDSLENYELIKE